ncbi:hypothetical protein EDD18DRAFT_1387587 [Armillaria luteobubalina]|uniref:F-box domain-containing protein n=1 Tax=Armillaria luteobubalina TaxID=153913 RepID=A0AA39P2A7_9AGAR|nr:hypothetical protein EDD18DRAFT_1387587 [Armillaria luteobubalina]
MGQYSDLPPELIDEVLLLLDLPSLKSLSLTSSAFHTICFPRLFSSLRLSRLTPTFFADFKKRAPTPCVRTIRMEWLNKDLSNRLLPWCTEAHTVKIERGTTNNTMLLTTLTSLHYVKLSSLKFRTLASFFKLLSALPPSLKKLTLFEIKIHNSLWPSKYTTVSRGVELEHLETSNDMNLSLLIRDDCPISLKSLRVACVQYCYPQHLEVLIQKTPNLIDLRLEFRSPSERPVSLPLTRLKSLTIRFETRLADEVERLFSTHPDVPCTLEDLTVILSWKDMCEPLAIALSHPKFRSLKSLNLDMTYYDYWVYGPCGLREFEEEAQKFQRRLEELGSEIDVRCIIRSVSEIVWLPFC